MVKLDGPDTSQADSVDAAAKTEVRDTGAAYKPSAVNDPMYREQLRHLAGHSTVDQAGKVENAS